MRPSLGATVGAKSGQKRQSAVSRFPDGDDAWLVVASAGGSAQNPAWYHNIAAHPDQVWIEFRGEARPPGGRKDGEADMDVRARGGELAWPDRRRGALIAAVQAVEVGANGHLAGHAGTVRGDGHGDLVGL